MEDWRGELLQAVEKILDHEHSLLASTMEGGREEQAERGEDRYQELLQQQVRVGLKLVMRSPLLLFV